MNVLVTAGNTQVPIDRVRCITNVFTGRTGANIALCAWQRGHQVRLLTSHPEVTDEFANKHIGFPNARWQLDAYRTFEDLQRLLEQQVPGGSQDVIFHAAAVSDYQFAGIFAGAEATRFDPDSATWTATDGNPRLVDRSAGKVKSAEAELWLRLVRAPKLVDLFRDPWGFTGVLVKFKLEVGTSVTDLEAIAERSRRHSRADFMVANTLEGAAEWALVGPIDGRFERLTRSQLAPRLLELAEAQRRGA